MRTSLFLLAGFLMLGAFLVLAKLFSQNYPAAAAWATGAFLGTWLMLTVLNLWVGLTKAGYSVGEELPILLLLFGIPAALAIVIKWKFI